MSLTVFLVDLCLLMLIRYFHLMICSTIYFISALCLRKCVNHFLKFSIKTQSFSIRTSFQ